MHATDSYILFQLAGATYGLPSANVQHIEMLEHITLVPNAHHAIDGVVFSRGQIIPALNLRARLGLPREPATLQTRIIVTLAAGRRVGLVVDSAREFRRIAQDQIRPISEALTGLATNYIRGIVTVNERLILLLDMDAALDLDRERSLAASLSEVAAGSASIVTAGQNP